MIENDAYDDSEYLSGGDYKWNYMLFELFDQSVDKDLPDWSQTRQYDHVTYERRILLSKLVRAFQLASR